MAPSDHETTFGRLIGELGPAVTRLARGYERDAARAEDLEQDIWLAVWQALPRFRGESSERTFVFRVAHNRAVSHVIRWRRRRTEPLDEVTDVGDGRPTPEQALTATDRRDRLRAALGRLPIGQRQVMLLVLEGLGHAEVAEVLGVRENAVSVRATRARRTLTRLLRPQEVQDDVAR